LPLPLPLPQPLLPLPEPIVSESFVINLAIFKIKRFSTNKNLVEINKMKKFLVSVYYSQTQKIHFQNKNKNSQFFGRKKIKKIFSPYGTQD